MPTHPRPLEAAGPPPDMWGVQESRKHEAAAAAAGGGGAKPAAAWREPAPEVPPWSSLANRRARARYDAEHAAPPTKRRRRKPRKGKRKVKGRSY